MTIQSSLPEDFKVKSYNEHYFSRQKREWNFPCYNLLMENKTFFFYDLETSGLSAREDRIMQFAGQRTDLELNPIGEPVNILVRMENDTLPSPCAIAVTKITPQKTREDGLSEAEFCRFLQEEIFTENTIALGFNTVRFDDEFMRHLFWRNFYDPYEWEWKDGRSRWDMLDVVRLTRALRPEGINWPFREDGKPTNRLELITKLNGIEHEHAHDALADVFATIAVAKLIKEKQPSLFNFLFNLRDKRAVKKLVNLENPVPFVYASGRYSSEFNNTTVAFPFAPAKNGNILVFDLRYDLEELMNKQDEEGKDKFYPMVKEMAYNKCPAVAPISVLEKNEGWAKIGLSKEQIETNIKTLLNHPEFLEERKQKAFEEKEWGKASDAESALYDSFLPDGDKVRVNAVRNANANELADFHPNFIDERLPELLLHYKAKNFPTSLSEDEVKIWETYRLSRLNRLEPKFMKELELVAKDEKNSFIVEELKLWYESLAPDF